MDSGEGRLGPSLVKSVERRGRELRKCQPLAHNLVWRAMPASNITEPRVSHVKVADPKKAGL